MFWDNGFKVGVVFRISLSQHQSQHVWVHCVSPFNNWYCIEFVLRTHRVSSTVSTKNSDVFTIFRYVHCRKTLKYIYLGFEYGPLSMQSLKYRRRRNVVGNFQTGKKDRIGRTSFLQWNSNLSSLTSTYVPRRLILRKRSVPPLVAFKKSGLVNGAIHHPDRQVRELSFFLRYIFLKE